MFLAKVHGFLPLFHLPTFVDEITRSLSAATPDTGTSRTEAAFILNGMFALSARFSMHDDFRDAAALSRGEPFARRAVDIFDRHLADSQEAPNLRILQGHILLACYYLSSGISSRAWRFTGMCVRMLYELNIHKVDHHHAIEGYVETPEEWVKTEEKRRAWWSAWELDNFASTVACRPFCCDRQVEVLLPVSDEDWFAGKPVRSAFLWTNRRAAWEGLADCENQAERAWFLVAVHLIRLATDITTLSSMESSSQRQNELETAMTCFRLALPPKFDLSCLFFKGDNWSNAAWAVSTHIMFQRLVLFCVSPFIFLSWMAANTVPTTAPAPTISYGSPKQRNIEGRPRRPSQAPRKTRRTIGSTRTKWSKPSAAGILVTCLSRRFSPARFSDLNRAICNIVPSNPPLTNRPTFFHPIRTLRL